MTEETNDPAPWVWQDSVHGGIHRTATEPTMPCEWAEYAPRSDYEMGIAQPLEGSARAMTSSLARQVDDYLLRMADTMNLTIEQMAEQYELEYHPLDVVSDSPWNIRATQTIRLVRRSDPTGNDE